MLDGGGGGAGGSVYGTGLILNGTYNIAVGKGALQSANPDNGENSTINIGGVNIIGAGGGEGVDGVNNGHNGGSGGGGASNSQDNIDRNGGVSTQVTSYTGTHNSVSYTFTGFGNNGGRGRNNESGGWDRAGGGGGGAGAVGNTSGDYTSDTNQATRISHGGDGGAGRQYNITGTNIFYAGGGGGGIHNNQQNGSPGSGGSGIGGTGGNPYNNGGNGTANTGSGGGAGGGGGNIGGNGGSGVVIIRYKFNVPSVKVGTVINDSYKYLTFLNTGSNETKYSIVLPQEIEIQILLLNNINYRELDVPYDISFGTFELIVGKNGLNTSFAQVSTGVNGSAINSGRVSNITGTNVTYDTPIAILRYRIKKTETVQNEVDGLLKYTKDNGWLIDTAISDTIVSNTSLIAILQSQMIQVFEALTAKSINAVYEWATDNQDWKIVEADSNISLPQGNFQIRLRVINLFANNAVLPYFITVRDTTRSDGVVANTYTTCNSSDVILYQRQHTSAKQQDLRIRIDDNEGFTSPFFNVTISNLQWLVNNRS